MEFHRLSRGYSADQVLNEIFEDSDEDIPVDSSELSSDEEDRIEVEEDVADVIVEEENSSELMDSEDEGRYTSKNGNLKFSKVPPIARKCPQENLLREATGIPIQVQNELASKADCFKRFITVDILQHICTHTNEKAHTFKLSKWLDMDIIELNSFLGLLIMSGVQKGRGKPLSEFWSADYGLPIFRATMSRHRFQDILRCLRFDNKETRAARQEISKNKAEAIRTVFEMFTEACITSYKPSSNITVDEHLCTYRGRCRFKVYIPSKPGKYGIKVWAAVDCETQYIVNAQIYTGKIEGSREVNQGKRVVLDLVSHLQGSGRNITTDNFFTSFELGQELLKKKLTLVGTLRSNRVEIPRVMLPARYREEHSSIFAYANNTLMVSCVPKPRKAVILLSTQHRSFDISSDEHKKPEVILFYNHTKSGVDTVDLMAKHYSVKRGTRRWPLALFFDIIDFAAINAFVLNSKRFNGETGKGARRKFLIDLAKELVEPEIRRRLQNPQTRTQLIREAITSAGFQHLFHSCVEGNSEQVVKKRGRCSTCPREFDRKVNRRCEKCGDFVCNDHAKMIISCRKCEGI